MNHLFVAGFDFGTSYSKVVVRDQFSGTAKVVTFGSRATGLFPSLVRVSDGGLAGPEHTGNGGTMLTYPKLFAADAAAGGNDFGSLYGDTVPALLASLRTDKLASAAHLVLSRYFLSVLDAIHCFLAGDEDWSDFDPASDPVVVQLAIPTGLMAGKDNPVATLMQESLATATLIRMGPRKPSGVSSTDELKSALQQLRGLSSPDREALDARCVTYPEVAAGVQTVLRSRNTPDGKYITIDVGAGTVDINAFLRRSRHVESPRLDYWACEVEPLGFARLDLGRTRTNRAAHERVVNPLPETVVLRQLDEAIGRLVGNACRFQPYKVAGDGPSPWQSETYAFAWGGGSAYPPYIDRFLSSLKSLGIGVGSVNSLPSPGDHFALPHDLAGNFGRLAVAYGLSYHQANLEAVHLPHQLKSFEELYPVRWEDSYRGPTGVCSCRGNPACPRCVGSGFIDPGKNLVTNWLPTFLPNFEDRPALSPKPQPCRFERALDNLIEDYHRFGKRMVLADRVRRLNQIRALLQRPEVQGNGSLISDAKHILLYNVMNFGGMVRLKTSSALEVADGCRVVVNLPQRPAEEMVVVHQNPSELAQSINIPAPPEYVEVGSTIRKSEHGEFFLLATQTVAHHPRG